MEYIDIMAERNLFSFRDSEMPTLFLMLAQDREVLEGITIGFCIITGNLAIGLIPLADPIRETLQPMA